MAVTRIENSLLKGIDEQTHKTYGLVAYFF